MFGIVTAAAMVGSTMEATKSMTPEQRTEYYATMRKFMKARPVRKEPESDPGLMFLGAFLFGVAIG